MNQTSNIRLADNGWIVSGGLPFREKVFLTLEDALAQVAHDVYRWQVSGGNPHTFKVTLETK